MDALAELIQALRLLPSVGPKSAQRMAYALLSHRERGMHLSRCLEKAMVNIKHCQRCNNHTSHTHCDLCLNPQRKQHMLCIVEHPADVAAIEQSHAYEGLYYVLMGRISPLEGIGPDGIGLEQLKQRIQSEPIQELIFALSPTVEGQTTIYFIQDLLRGLPIHTSQLAHGIPSGGELEFLDANTIGHAFRNRGKFIAHQHDEPCESA